MVKEYLLNNFKIKYIKICIRLESFCLFIKLKLIFKTNLALNLNLRSENIGAKE